MSLFPTPLMAQVPPDTTAPLLNAAAASATGETTAAGSVATDEGNGTLYWVVSTSGTQPTASQVKAGNMHTGAQAAASGSQAVSSTGTKNVSASGLSASTAYYFHFMQEDLAGNQSVVRASAAFTTDAAVTPGNQTFTADGTFTVPNFHTLSVYVYGGGGGGGGGISSASLGGDGGDSSFAAPAAVIGRGGKGGEGRNLGGDGGAGGTAQGGGTNTPGEAGENHGTGSDNYGGAGGDCAGPDGGDGGDRTTAIGKGHNGTVAGGGGSGGYRAISTGGGGGGGAGGYAKKTFASGQLTVGADIAVVVGAGGVGGNGFSDGGAGAVGRVYVEWS